MTNIEKKMIARLLEIGESRHFKDKTYENLIEEVSNRSPGIEQSFELESMTLPGWDKERINDLIQSYSSKRLSIILQNNRPLVPVEKDSFKDLDATLWKEINDKRSMLTPMIKGTGKIKIKDSSGLLSPATAFLCGQNRVITNRHVADTFIHGQGEGMQLSFLRGYGADIDFKEEAESSEILQVKVTAPVLVMPSCDIAVLEIESTPPGIKPLPLMSRVPENLPNRTVVVVGFPGEEMNEDYDTVHNLLQRIFGKKRLQPGKIKGMVRVETYGSSAQALTYDCTTLGGNSGSAVIDVASGRVIGIHYSGKSFDANFAVPSWDLAQNASVRASGVVFD